MSFSGAEATTITLAAVGVPSLRLLQNFEIAERA